MNVLDLVFFLNRRFNFILIAYLFQLETLQRHPCSCFSSYLVVFWWISTAFLLILVGFGKRYFTPHFYLSDTKLKSNDGQTVNKVNSVCLMCLIFFSVSDTFLSSVTVLNRWPLTNFKICLWLLVLKDFLPSISVWFKIDLSFIKTIQSLKFLMSVIDCVLWLQRVMSFFKRLRSIQKITGPMLVFWLEWLLVILLSRILCFDLPANPNNEMKNLSTICKNSRF